MLCRSLAAALTLCFLLAQAPATGLAQPVPAAPGAPAGTFTGRITDVSEQPIGGVTVKLGGPASREATTAADGTFSFDALPPGTYDVDLTKAGFTPIRSSATVSAGNQTAANIQLTAASLSSIKVIGRVSTDAARIPLNTSTAALATVSAQSFLDQGQLNIGRTLNTIPGVQLALSTSFGSDFLHTTTNGGANPFVGGFPSLRGSLEYETAALIDGHPINLGLDGTFNPAFLNPYILQDVEIVKGPGASATNINYAIGGTINYRTLEPTRTPKQSADLGIDQFGGENANFRATGTTPDGKFGYALDYATWGFPGWQRGWDTLNPLVYLGPGSTVNGQVVCGNSAAAGCGLGVVPTNTPYEASVNFTTPLALCCSQTPQGDNTRNELAKVRYNFSPSTSLTFSYLGAQLRSEAGAMNAYGLPQYLFIPPTGYSGSLASGTNTYIDLQQATGIYAISGNLYTAELRSTLGPVTLNARYYTTNVAEFIDYGNIGTTFSGTLYGGVPLGNSLTPTIFNGTAATVVTQYSDSFLWSRDKLGGFTVQGSAPLGSTVLSASFDSVDTKTTASDPFSGTIVPAGSGQHFQTAAVQAQFQLLPTLTANLANYATLYRDNYSQDLGVTFQSSTHAYDVPRLSFEWRPQNDLAVRAATGYSIAPPYINLLTNGLPAPNQGADPSYFTLKANAGDVSPETSFGWDAGADKRFGGSWLVSTDLYQTVMRNQFLPSTALAPQPYVISPSQGTLGSPAGTYPLYITKTANLGHSRYEGVEFSVRRAPPSGWGMVVQGSLQRAYAYDLPPGFYATALGPYTTNLAVFQGENFMPNGNGYNSISQSRVPYSQGYAEVNYRTPFGTYASLGATYLGPNNAYNEPPFAIVDLSIQQPVTKYASLLLTVQNVTGAYSNFVGNDYGGIPAPLADGKLGWTYAQQAGPTTARLILHLGL